MRRVRYLPAPSPSLRPGLARWVGLYLSLRLVLQPGPATEENPHRIRTASAGLGEAKDFLPAPKAQCPECEVPRTSLNVPFHLTCVLFLVAAKEMPHWAATHRTKDGGWAGALQGRGDTFLGNQNPHFKAGKGLMAVNV